METHTASRLTLTAGHLTRQNIALADVRRRGSNAFPGGAPVWHDVTRSSVIEPGAVLGIQLIEHMVAHNVLKEHEALSGIAFFQEPLTRYADHLTQALEGFEQAGENHDLKLPVAMLEVVDGRFMRLSGAPSIFDVQEQGSAQFIDEGLLYSHSVCLVPLFTRLLNDAESDTGD